MLDRSAVAVVGSQSDPHVAWIADQRFGVVWAQEAQSELGPPGLYTSSFSADGLGPAALVAPTSGDFAFTVVRHEAAGELIAALRVNRPGSAAIELYALPIVAGETGTRRLLLRREQSAVPEGFGFTVPAISERGRRAATRL